MDNFIKKAVVGNVVVTIGILALLLTGAGHSPSPQPQGNYLVDAGSQNPSFGATAAALSSTVFSHLTNLEVYQNLGAIGTIFQGADANTGTPLQTNVSVGSCNTASSTLFAIAPPSGATSTVTSFIISGVSARTTDIVVGTSTLASVSSTSTLNVAGAGGLEGMAAVVAGQFYSVAGLKVGTGKGYTVSGNGPYNSVSSIVVGPQENLVGYATSTATTGGNSVTSCTYKIEWQN